ncbi:hypothetical protein BDM02DRAFT_3123844 [Thelephora ganbajun]|uniref:Uncharacterized protein n=1 Tax=Thelephora ganbajun TaxID=370292 RepID=A0ACB6Z072_THEGA|nr:hypothetical protein BDM02DRAFT_3123844 [Thelephora ganbajun]
MEEAPLRREPLTLEVDMVGIQRKFPPIIWGITEPHVTVNAKQMQELVLDWRFALSFWAVQRDWICECYIPPKSTTGNATDPRRLSQLGMDLPQELLDEVLNRLPLDDKYDQLPLRNCSLVAKSWVQPGRRRLFETREIREICCSWLDNIPPTSDGLLQHVHLLPNITSTRMLRIALQSEHHVDVFQYYFLTLHH